MLFAAFVVGVVCAAERFNHGFIRNLAPTIPARSCRFDGGFKCGKTNPCVSTRGVGDSLNQLFWNLGLEMSLSSLIIRERALKNCFYLFLRKRIKHENTTARQQRSSHLEGRIFSSSADQSDCTVFNCVQQCILLAFIEAMYLIDEQNGSPCKPAFVPRICDCFPQIFDT